jgi:hypothetical protein
VIICQQFFSFCWVSDYYRCQMSNISVISWRKFSRASDYYGQTNMKRALTLAKINHPWNWYNMHMLRSWPTKIPSLNKIQQKTKHHVKFHYYLILYYTSTLCRASEGITARQRVQFHFSSSIMAQILNSKWLFASNSSVFVEWVIIIDAKWAIFNKHEKGFNSRKNQPSVKLV